MMKSRFLSLLIAGSLIAAGAAIGGYFYHIPTRSPAGGEWSDHPTVKSLRKAVDIIESRYYGSPNSTELVRGAVLGALHNLDPHSSYFDRREFNEMQNEQSSRFHGIGVTVNQRNGRIYVLSVSQGMPAQKTGLRYGDAIVAVDGQPTRGWSQQDILKHVRGRRGTPVQLTIERLGEPELLNMRIVRDEVPFPSVRNHFMLKPGIGYIGLTGGFNQTSADEVRDALADLKVKGLSSLVLDLRRNPGGVFRQAVEVAEVFLPRDEGIVTVRSRQGQTNQQIYYSENREPETMPLVVLIDQESASASEIVAGAIQDRDRGLIVGEASFGKGLVQTVFRLPGGTGLVLTTAKYFTPSGRSIQRAYAGIGYYDYYFARFADGNQKRTDKAADTAVYTPLGRPLSSGGGIEPDIRVTVPADMIKLRDACFEFARRLAAGLVAGLETYKIDGAEYDYELRGIEFPITDTIFAALRSYLRDHTGLRITDAELMANQEYARRRLRAELITAAYGIRAAEQFLMESDPQAVKAIEAIPRAKHLSDLARVYSSSNPVMKTSPQPKAH
jgi:carboxyl-terminal processing protease